MSKRYIVEREFEHAGYKCVVTFGVLGHRCGYVGIPKTHPLYGKGYDECQDICCHGGLTYSGGGDKSKHPIESDLWWFGFDCAHYGDGKDLKLAYKKFLEERASIAYMMKSEQMFPEASESDVLRTEEYVADECKRLAEQLKEFEKE